MMNRPETGSSEHKRIAADLDAAILGLRTAGRVIATVAAILTLTLILRSQL